MAGIQVKIKVKPKKGANKLKRIGSRKRQIEHYYADTYAKTKLRNIIRSSGVGEARAWADRHGALAEFNKLVQ
jgi:hypothetical protein